VTNVSVVIPVKDGERYLERVLAAVVAQGDAEVLVIDSGSRDRSREIARAARVELLEIEPGEFGHGRTRNLGAQRTSGELICFLTQDAEPVEGWLAGYREAFGLGDRVGAAYGPHLPRPGTSPMIARELEEFFATFSPNGRAVVQHAGDPSFLSNVNACYARGCWEEIRFPDVPYSEDQAFGRAMLAAGWSKVYQPAAAVLHAHDYGAVGFMRRYFDEYRGLRRTTGHVEPLGSGRDVARQVRADLRWMEARDWPARRRARWAGRSVAHQAGRRAFGALGSRADRLPGALQRAISLEGRQGEAAAPRGVQRAGRSVPTPHDEVLRLSRDGPAPLLDAVPGTAERARLHLAVIIPPFQRGSGGHGTIFNIVSRLEGMGHTCSVWLHDPHGSMGRAGSAMLRRRVVEEFSPVRAPVVRGFDGWHGADVVVATGWETVYPAMLLPGCHVRAYLVNDHEPDFFATSAEAIWAERTYSLGLYPISAGRWLRDLLERRYGSSGSWFRLGVDHRTYAVHPVERRRDTVIFYARAATPRRAVPLGLLALEELVRRRPGVRVVTFGQEDPLETSIPYEQLGVAKPTQLARAYSEATVGLCLSLTNYSLIPQEMMACGLPCVDLAGGSSEVEFGSSGPAQLAAADPVAIADALEALIEDEELWRRRSESGLEFVAEAGWDLAARQVEAGLRQALREREAVGAR
jgi:glycosyltransferase involved in cell wall biosynthesis